MEKHALAVLNDLNSYVPLESTEANHQGITGRLLHHLIIESEHLGGSILEEFWRRLGSCHPRLDENIQILKAAPKFVSEKATTGLVFQAVPKTEVSCEPLFSMAGKYFTGLGFAFMDPKDEMVNGDMDDEDMRVLRWKTLGLRTMVFERDGSNCVLTGLPLEYPETSGERYLNVDRFPHLSAQLIPIAILKNGAALECIALLAGDKTLNFVLQHINNIGNAVVVGSTAAYHFDYMSWAIDATFSDGEVKYIYHHFYPDRSVLVGAIPGQPLEICLDEGRVVEFGKGTAAERLGGGPLPEFCKLRLALADTNIDKSEDSRERAVASFYLQLACLK